MRPTILTFNLTDARLSKLRFLCMKLGLDNMIITPHIAWAATEARQRLLSVAIDNVRQYLAGNVQNNVAK